MDPRRAGDLRAWWRGEANSGDVQVIGRILAVAVAVPLLAVGAVALATAHLPEQALVETTLGALLQVASQLASVEALGLPEDLPERVESALAGVLLRATGLSIAMRSIFSCKCASLILPNRYIFHLRSHDALAGIVHLTDIPPSSRP